MIPIRFFRKEINHIRLLTLNTYATCNFLQNVRLPHLLSQQNCSHNLSINNIDLEDYVSKLKQEYEALSSDEGFVSNPRYLELKPVVHIIKEKQLVLESLKSLKELIDTDDADISNMAKEEQVQFEDKLKQINNELFEALVPADLEVSYDSIILEVQAGVGGKEAMLFAQEMFQMYCNFILHKGWEYEIAEYQAVDLGGLRRASVLVNGPEAFKYFKYEAGVHRVQRTPATEKSGRIHTSTISVVALPQPSEIDVKIDPKDLKIETKRSTGAGGQHVNTTDSAVRMTHLPTNIAVECQTDRSQIKNRKLALARLRAILYQRQLDQQIAQTKATRRSQVKSNDRNEKIRTYNYNQDRITDHRLQGVHFHNLEGFMEGGQELGELIEQLDKQTKIDCLLELAEKVNK